MESLAQYLKNMQDSPMMKNAEQQAKQLMKNPLIVKLKEKYPDVTDDILKLNLNRLYQYVTEYQNCSQCPGLERCPNDFTGHYTTLTVEQVNQESQMFDHKVPCKKQLAKQSQSAIQSRIHSFYVDERALNAGYSLKEIIERDPMRAKAVRQVMDYVLSTKKNGLQANGLYLSGSFGTGKTFLMCYMLYELAKEGLTGAIVYMPDFVEDLKSMFSEQGKIKETIELLKHADLLIFDDIGAENLNPWTRDHVMGAILNYRMNRKPTFFTSNYDLDGLEKHMRFTNKDGDEEYKGMRIMDRIRPFVEEVAVHGENKRGQV